MNRLNSISGRAAVLAIAIALVVAAYVFLPLDGSSKAQNHDAHSAVMKLWGERRPPGTIHTRGAEGDLTKATDDLIAGQRIIKLGNVTSPELHIFPRDEGTVGDAAVIVCPGGGFSILAWDLEGLEVAKWLNSIGVTVGVLKYRVPTNKLANVWKAPVQDTQRAISLMRNVSGDFDVDPDKVGVLGFSAGAIAAARSGLMRERQYKAVDEIDENSCSPNFVMLVYAGGLIDETTKLLKEDLMVDAQTPPVFMVHAFDDHVVMDTPVALLKAMKAAEVPAELHVYDAGGHGYGLRRIDGLPVTTWPERGREWLDRNGLLKTATAMPKSASQAASQTATTPMLVPETTADLTVNPKPKLAAAVEAAQ